VIANAKKVAIAKMKNAIATAIAVVNKPSKRRE